MSASLDAAHRAKEDLFVLLHGAIADPGRYCERDHAAGETVSAWSARATALALLTRGWVNLDRPGWPADA